MCRSSISYRIVESLSKIKRLQSTITFSKVFFYNFHLSFFSYTRSDKIVEKSGIFEIQFWFVFLLIENKSLLIDFLFFLSFSGKYIHFECWIVVESRFIIFLIIEIFLFFLYRKYFVLYFEIDILNIVNDRLISRREFISLL